MNNTMRSWVAGGAAVLAAASLAYAQQQPPPTQQQQTAPGAAAARAVTKRPLSEVLMRMSRDTGFVVVADSSVAGVSVEPPAEATTAQNLEAQVAALVRTLPSGATWGRLYLPAPPPGGRGYNGDAVADYALAQAKLFGKVGDAPAGQVEVLGKTLATDAAAPVVSALELKPVYLVTNPSARAAAAAAPAAPGTAPAWTQMSEQQRQQFAQQEAQRIMSMDPAARQQFLQQQGAVMRAMMRNMTPDQRRQMFQGMGGWGGGRDGRRDRGNRGGGF